MPDLSLTSAFQFELPDELIAKHPAEPRDSSRLLRLDRRTGKTAHHTFRDLPRLLNAGDLLIVNESKVLPARLFGRRARTGGRWEGLYLDSLPGGEWRIICQTRGTLQPGEEIIVEACHGAGSSMQADALTLTLLDRDPNAVWRVRVDSPRPAVLLLEEFGTMPLPPYMGRRIAEESDRDRYQTVYARDAGSVAAPTAGLHFTPELLEACAAMGIERAAVTLHVGLGTFRPVEAERLDEHRMHREWCSIPAETAGAIERCRSRGGRIVAVGTTTMRTLESCALHHQGRVVEWQGETDLFIRPAFEFRVADALLTNFHLPGSTLLVLVAAFAGYESALAAYHEAIHKGYRFYSYGDAMLIGDFEAN
jgi:S-adenosylmethionine:tRNA ribosyltransferase-isomerase